MQSQLFLKVIFSFHFKNLDCFNPFQGVMQQNRKNTKGVNNFTRHCSVPVRHFNSVCAGCVHERAECRCSSQRLSKFILISTASRWLPLFSLHSHRVFALPLSCNSRWLGKISSDFSFSLSMIDEGTAVNVPCHCCWLTAALLYSMSDTRRCVHVYKRCDACAGCLLIRRVLQQVRARGKKKKVGISFLPLKKVR